MRTYVLHVLKPLRISDWWFPGFSHYVCMYVDGFRNQLEVLCIAVRTPNGSSILRKWTPVALEKIYFKDNLRIL